MPKMGKAAIGSKIRLSKNVVARVEDFLPAGTLRGQYDWYWDFSKASNKPSYVYKTGHYGTPRRASTKMYLKYVKALEKEPESA